uniref:Uncharacterized protein n=1 Tax=Panagrolaimus superbus TaxID=310955 RepID=A0A914XVL3_9BILA
MASLIGFIDGANAQLYITIVHESTGSIVSTVQSFACQSFINIILPKLFNSTDFKAVIINTCNVISTDFKDTLQFRKAVKEKLDQMKIINYYITKENFVQSQCLIAANYSSNLDDIVLIVMGAGENVVVSELRYTENGYKILRTDRFLTNERQRLENPEAISQRIYSFCKPKKIILSSANFELSAPPKYLKAMLKLSNKLIVVDRQNFIDISIIETFKMFDDKSYVKFRILPICSREYHLGFKYGSKCHRKIVAEFGEALPFKKSVFVSKSCLEFYNAHRNELVLEVDEGNLPTFQVKEIILDSVKNLPKKLSANLKGIPIIAFYDDSSVICVWKNGKFQFLDGWNGMYGKQLLIAFDEVKPKFCDEASEAHRRKPSFVVSDLIKIMSRSPEEQQINNCHFKITKDSKNPILIEFDNYGGIKKAATPAFLMAMLLKEHFKAIKEETTNLKLTEFGFYFIDETEDEKIERIKKQIKESCGMLKIGCNFVT